MYFIALIAFIFGVLVYYDLSLSKTRKLYNKAFTYSLFIKYSVPKKTIIIVRVLFFIILMLFLLTYGKEIFIRTDYLPDTNRVLVIIIKILSFIEVILLGILYQKKSFISLIYFLLLVLISLGTGSRTVFLFMLTYSTLLFISKGNTLINKLKFSFNIFLSLIFLAYLMQLRGLNTHGVIPYLKSIPNLNENFISYFFFNIYYSLIFGVYVTIKTVQIAQPDWNILFLSLNPLPGSLVGWYKYADSMRLNEFAPFSLHGRIFKMGALVIIAYFFMTGLIFSFMEKKIRTYLDGGKRGVAFIIVLLLSLHIVYGFEYNLRSAFRYIYYALFIIFIVYLFKYIKPYLLKNKSNIG